MPLDGVLKRRERLKMYSMRILVFLVMVAVISTCEKQSEGVSEEKTGLVLEPIGTTSEKKYNESPMLAKLVKEGKLPPVQERLPKEPRVGVIDIPEDELKPEIGRYGGTLRLIDYDPGQIGHDANWILNESLLVNPGLSYDPENLQGNIVKDFKLSADGKDITFYMRRGMKWSDGRPLTTDDVEFWYKSVLFNKEITPVLPVQYRSGGRPDGKPMEIEVIDDYTFKFIFDNPYPGFLASLRYGPFVIPPKHFFKQFHPDYTPMKELEPLIKKYGFEKGEWWRLYGYMSDIIRQHETGYPCYYPYVIKRVTPSTVIFERNPYYWKVDRAGNQLPYIDRMQVTIVNNTETVPLKIIGNEVDLARRPVTIKNVPIYKQFAKRKGYRVLLMKQHASLAEVILNLTNPDPVWRKVVGDIRFREALSLAIDRQKIINAIYYRFGAGLPRTIPINEYNPERANQLLDEMGLDKRDKDGWRLGPDGKKFMIPFEMTIFTGEEVKTAEMVGRCWGKVGIFTTTKVYDNTLWLTMADANELNAFTWWQHYARWPFDEPDYLGRAWQCTYAPLWYNWYNSNGKLGEKPPAEYIRLRQLYDEMMTVGGAKWKDIWNEMKRIIVKNIWYIPIVDDCINPLIVNEKLGNVPDKGYAILVASTAEQMFFKEE